jgi:hypothetical protein
LLAADLDRRDAKYRRVRPNAADDTGENLPRWIELEIEAEILRRLSARAHFGISHYWAACQEARRDVLQRLGMEGADDGR